MDGGGGEDEGGGMVNEAKVLLWLWWTNRGN